MKEGEDIVSWGKKGRGSKVGERGGREISVKYEKLRGGGDVHWILCGSFFWSFWGPCGILEKRCKGLLICTCRGRG